MQILRQGIVLLGLGSLGSMVSAQQGAGQRPQIPNAKREQLLEVMRKLNELSQPFFRLNLKTRRTKSISNEDLAKIKDFQTAKFDLPTKNMDALRSEATLALLYVTPATLKPGQEATIIEIVQPTLAADDLKTDPKGGSKMYALMIVRKTVRNKSLLPLVRKLKNDPREWVRLAAAKAEKQLAAAP